MARKKRTPSPTGLYHWIVRGIHKKHIFHRSEDFQVFKDLLLRHKIKFSISIHHYCLMETSHSKMKRSSLMDLKNATNLPAPIPSMTFANNTMPHTSRRIEWRKKSF